MEAALKLSVHDAQIKTMTVEINTMIVGRKQVTLSLFRQFGRGPHRPQGNLNGDPWGNVNYCPGKDCAGTGMLCGSAETSCCDRR